MHSNIRRMDKANGGKHNFRLFIKINCNIQIIRFTVTNHLFTRLEFSNTEIKTLINRFGMSKASNGAIPSINPTSPLQLYRVINYHISAQ